MKIDFRKISLCLIIGASISCARKLDKRQTVSSTCSVDSFNCSNGVCIDSSLVCDGKTDCSDSSDETRQLCTQLIANCASYAFRCSYGACVDKTAKCNGVKDCVDGSDENLAECNGGVPSLVQPNESKCQLNQYNCKSGQCIDETSTCDGLRDCSDGSDETFTLCRTNQCPSFSFKCHYGACISKEKRCDGTKHCIDGSDEVNCITKTPKPPIITTKTTQRPIKPTTPTSSTKITCVIPNSEGSVYSLNNTNQKAVLSPGTLIGQYSIVEENCQEGFYKTVPYRFMICSGSGQWEPSVNDKLCLKMCPPMTSDSVDMSCIFNGETTDCSKPSKPGTRLSPQCKVTHSVPNGQFTPIALRCLSDGKWSGQLFTCVPYCGREFIPTKPLISNGVKAKYGSSPWNAGIYQMNGNNSYSMICGGSLIAPNLVVSAAHCFWQEGLSDRIITNENNRYKIAVGKHSINISEKDNEFTQIIDAGLILLDEYYGSSGFHANDIAIIVLSIKVIISNGVLPVCIDWDKQYTQQNGAIGKIVGWGKTEKMIPSEHLLEAHLPYMDHNTCRNRYTNGFELFVTSDKFCAGSTLGQGVQEGDSGAGLTFVHNKLHYLTGVVSVKDPTSNDAVAVFTDVNHHIPWLRNNYVNYTFA